MGRKKKEAREEKKETEDVITDIAREYFIENGVGMVKIVTYCGKTPISVKTIPTSEDDPR